MEKETLKFELSTTKVDNDIVITNYERVLEAANSIVNSFTLTSVNNDIEKRDAKNFRASCNKAVDAIKRLRIDTINGLVETFESECKTLETIFTTKAKEIDALVKNYEETTNPLNVKPKAIKVVLTYYDEKLTSKITDFCVKNGIKMEVK